MPPSQYLDEARFRQARILLETKPGIQVKEVAYSVGFLKVKYFSQRFYQKFGKYPSEYKENLD
jgi:transcriptional regulator GlxA family with amidase domain